jgi:glycerol kinase
MFVAALDQGTASTRFMVFDASGTEVSRRQLEHSQILPAPGWVEHDPVEIAARVDEVIAGALRSAGLTGRDLAAIGITNQRETTVVWNPRTGRPWYNAIVWQDTRTAARMAALESQRKWLVADLRCTRRPARRNDGTGVFHCGRGEEHVRHG